MQFINPYHFIGLSGKPNRSLENNRRSQSKPKKEELLTGVINYELTTKSRLHIPNTTTDKAFAYCPAIKTDKDEGDVDREHKRYDFFSYHTLENKEPDAVGLIPGTVSAERTDIYTPVIPGSEVRGMIRTIYETLTNSCLPVIDGETRIAKRSVEQYKPGILTWEKNGIVLWEATDSIFRNSDDFSEKKFMSDELKEIQDGSLVYYCKSERKCGKPIVTAISKEQEGMNSSKGYLLKGESGPEMAPNPKLKQLCDSCVNHKYGAVEYCSGDSQEKHCYLKEKHCAHVFETNRKKVGNIDEVTLKELELIIKQYQSNAKTAPSDRKSEYKEYQITYEDFENKKVQGLPVYYSQLYGDRYLLSPACITREVYRHTEKDIVGEYLKCGSREQKGEKDKVEMCPACGLFGIVSNEVNQGSRIRFSDLQLNSEKHADYKDCYDKDLLTLEELAAPKLSTTEFYLQRPQPSGDEVQILFWTYDYYIAELKNGTLVAKEHQPTISGRKFYWHNRSELKSAEVKNKRNRTVRTVKKDIAFTGKLYFDGITEKQLQQLVYILNYTADGKHGYKLGTGKPLGLGSVELKIQSVQKRSFSNGCYQNATYELKSASYEAVGFDNSVKNAFELITAYMDPSDEKIVQYPTTGKAEDEGFKWFENNRKGYRIEKDGRINYEKRELYPKERRQMKIEESLPGIMNGNALPIMGGQNGSARNSYEAKRQNTPFAHKETQGGQNPKQGVPSTPNVKQKENKVKPFENGKIYQATVIRAEKKGKIYVLQINVTGADKIEYQKQVVSKKMEQKGAFIKVKAKEHYGDITFEIVSKHLA